jgi:hypothetical protein
MKRTHVKQAEAAGFARAFGREADAISKRAIGQDRKSDLAWRSAVSSNRINGRALRVWRNAGQKFVMHFDGANTAAMIRSGLAAAVRGAAQPKMHCCTGSRRLQKSAPRV